MKVPPGSIRYRITRSVSCTLWLFLRLHGEKDMLCFYKDGCVQAFDEDLALSILSETAVRFSCNMNVGSAEATAWGCDLTYDYVRINGDYRS